jgi:AcrR family transcriptional regulator
MRDAANAAGAVRRRDDVLMEAIREATRAELADFGYSGVTYEGVARRARTSKPVLYRRYPSRAHMVVDALPNLRWKPDDDGIAPSQSLREDLLALFGTVVDNFLAIGIDNYRSLIGDADDDLFNFLDAQVTGLAERVVYPALARARERGEIGPCEIPRRAATSIGVLLRDEMVFARNDVGADNIAELLDTVYLPLIRTVSAQPPGRAPDAT